MARLAVNFRTQEIAAFSTFLRFLKWKMDGKLKMENAHRMGHRQACYSADFLEKGHRFAIRFSHLLQVLRRERRYASPPDKKTGLNPRPPQVAGRQGEAGYTGKHYGVTQDPSLRGPAYEDDVKARGNSI